MNQLDAMNDQSEEGIPFILKWSFRILWFLVGTFFTMSFFLLTGYFPFELGEYLVIGVLGGGLTAGAANTTLHLENSEYENIFLKHKGKILLFLLVAALLLSGIFTFGTSSVLGLGVLGIYGGIGSAISLTSLTGTWAVVTGFTAMLFVSPIITGIVAGLQWLKNKLFVSKEINLEDDIGIANSHDQYSKPKVEKRPSFGGRNKPSSEVVIHRNLSQAQGSRGSELNDSSYSDPPEPEYVINLNLVPQDGATQKGVTQDGATQDEVTSESGSQDDGVDYTINEDEMVEIDLKGEPKKVEPEKVEPEAEEGVSKLSPFSI